MSGGRSRPSTQGKGRRLPRAERREQILAAATVAFARHGGFTATALDDVMSEAGVTRMILYRHFDSKDDLYRAVLDRAATQLHEATTEGGRLTEGTWDALLGWATTNPEAFRLLFHHAASEPDFSQHVGELRDGMTTAIRGVLHDDVSPSAREGWAAQLVTTVVIEGILAWFDTGRPDPEQLSDRLRNTAEAVTKAITE